MLMKNKRFGAVELLASRCRAGRAATGDGWEHRVLPQRDHAMGCGDEVRQRDTHVDGSFKKYGGIVLLHFAVAILRLPFYNLLRSLSYAIHSWSLIHG